MAGMRKQAGDPFLSALQKHPSVDAICSKLITSRNVILRPDAKSIAFCAVSG